MMERERVNNGAATEGVKVTRAKPNLKALRKKAKANDLNQIEGRDRRFDAACLAAKVPLPVSGFQPHPAMPFLTHSWPEMDLGLLVGRASRESLNAAAMLGWRMIVVDEFETVDSVIGMVKAAMEERMP